MKRLPATLGAVLFVATAANAVNGANDYLLSVTPQIQATTLAKAVGQKCRGETAYYMGIGKSGLAQNKGFWSIRCTDGRPFLVQDSLGMPASENLRKARSRSAHNGVLVVEAYVIPDPSHPLVFSGADPGRNVVKRCHGLAIACLYHLQKRRIVPDFVDDDERLKRVSNKHPHVVHACAGLTILQKARFLRAPPLQTLVGKPEIVERYHQTTKDDAEVALVGQPRKSRQSRAAPHIVPPVSCPSISRDGVSPRNRHLRIQHRRHPGRRMHFGNVGGDPAGALNAEGATPQTECRIYGRPA